MYQLRLYLMGGNLKGSEALCELRDGIEALLHGGSEMEVLNLLENPELAEQDQIFVTPTLIRLEPKPVKRIVGSFEDVGRLTLMLKRK